MAKGTDERPPSQAETAGDISQHRIDYIEQHLPTDVPRTGLLTISGGALVVPTHVAVVRHAAWLRWTPGAIWGSHTHWGGEVPLGLESSGSIRRDVARALAAHDENELAELAALPGWEWLSNAVPPAPGGPDTHNVPVGSGTLDTVEAARGPVGGAPYERQEYQFAPHDKQEVFARDPDLIDRGTAAHMHIQNLLSELVESRGFAPLRPIGVDPKFDLAWRVGSAAIVCEVKSLTADDEVSQLRLGLGQLLSYLYKLSWPGTDEVRGVLAVEREPVDADWVSICAAGGVVLTWAPDFPGVFPMGLQTEQ